MKLIKKIAAIMFAFMMVFSLSTNVKADDSNEGTQSTVGSITINNAIPGHEYKLYKILILESYNNTNAAYSYKVTDTWRNFLENTNQGGKYFTEDGNKYVTWKNDVSKDPAKMREFVTDANTYIETLNKPDYSGVCEKNKSSITIGNLTPGYYFIKSATGALCMIDTAKPNVTVDEKNSAPTISKVIDNGKRPTTGHDYNSVNIGDVFSYKIDINVGEGAQNYKLVDTLDKGLDLLNSEFNGKNTGFSITAANYTKTQLDEHVDYEVNIDSETNKFTITFLQACLNNCNENTVIDVRYSVRVNENAKIDKEMLNDAVLEYGTNSKTEHAITETYTHGFKVYKYTTTGGEKGLKGAKFKLYTLSETGEKNYYKFSKSTDGSEYKNSGATGEEILVSPDGGKFNIVGLKEGTYFLEETEAPKGYNKLSAAVKVEITLNADKSKTVKFDGTERADYEAQVLNNTGDLLSSTGGMGTTLIYLIGGALVLGSGFVLANKKRAKAK